MTANNDACPVGADLALRALFSDTEELFSPEVETHLAQCQSCREQYATIRRISEANVHDVGALRSESREKILETLAARRHFYRRGPSHAPEVISPFRQSIPNLSAWAGSI